MNTVKSVFKRKHFRFQKSKFPPKFNSNLLHLQDDFIYVYILVFF